MISTKRTKSEFGGALVSTSNVLSTNGDSDVHQLLDGETVGLLVGHHRDVVETIEVGKTLTNESS